MASQTDILQVIASHPDGVTLQQISQELGVKPQALTKSVSDLRKKGVVAKSDQGIYTLTAEAGAAAREAENDTGVLPTSYDKFKSIGHSLGVPEPFLSHVCDYVFSLQPEEIEPTRKALLNLALRPDVVARWVTMWAAFLGKPLPETSSIERQTSRYSVIGHGPTAKIKADVEGVLSWGQALEELEIRLQAKPSENSEEVQELRKTLEGIKERIHQSQLSALQEEIQSLRALVGNQGGGSSGKTAYDLLSQALVSLNEKLPDKTDMRMLVRQMAASKQEFTLGPRTSEERDRELGGLVTDMEAEANLREIAEWVFDLNGGDGADLTPRRIAPKGITVVEAGAGLQTRGKL